MIYYIILILIIVVLASGVVKLYLDKKESQREVAVLEKEKNELEDIGVGLAEYQQKLNEKKEKIKNKILEMLGEKARVSNKDVSKKLGVPRTSAFRYLEELEKEGKIKQVFKTGRSVYYNLK